MHGLALSGQHNPHEDSAPLNSSPGCRRRLSTPEQFPRVQTQTVDTDDVGLTWGHSGVPATDKESLRLEMKPPDIRLQARMLMLNHRPLSGDKAVVLYSTCLPVSPVSTEKTHVQRAAKMLRCKASICKAEGFPTTENSKGVSHRYSQPDYFDALEHCNAHNQGKAPSAAVAHLKLRYLSCTG